MLFLAILSIIIIAIGVIVYKLPVTSCPYRNEPGCSGNCNNCQVPANKDISINNSSDVIKK